MLVQRSSRLITTYSERLTPCFSNLKVTFACVLLLYTYFDDIVRVSHSLQWIISHREDLHRILIHAPSTKVVKPPLQP